MYQFSIASQELRTKIVSFSPGHRSQSRLLAAGAGRLGGAQGLGLEPQIRHRHAGRDDGARDQAAEGRRLKTDRRLRHVFYTQSNIRNVDFIKNPTEGPLTNSIRASTARRARLAQSAVSIIFP